ncbi:DUF5994 family protein [Streptomyces sp. NPDC006743]|uniref:DUF5994 family protein n=1 Tax=Streptomyces sp. NPDC006743 TaxID=3154480 RepID=UPI0034531C0A
MRPGAAPAEAGDDAREGILDGARWPRSRDMSAELPSLISALTEHLEPVTRVGQDGSAWDGLPPRVMVDGRVVHTDSSRSVTTPSSSPGAGDRDHFSLMLVPPDTSPDAARAATARAVRADDVTKAGQMLIDTGGVTPSAPA